MTKRSLLFLPLFLFTLAAQAYSGKELLEDCQAAEASLLDNKPGDPYQSMRGARCMAYVAGFADGYAVGDFLAGKIGVQLNAFCLPEGEDRQYRLVRAVLAHIEKQPPNTTASSRTLVAGALSKAFPCGQ